MITFNKVHIKLPFVRHFQFNNFIFSDIFSSFFIFQHYISITLKFLKEIVWTRGDLQFFSVSVVLTSTSHYNALPRVSVVQVCWYIVHNGRSFFSWQCRRPSVLSVFSQQSPLVSVPIFGEAFLSDIQPDRGSLTAAQFTKASNIIQKTTCNAVLRKDVWHKLSNCKEICYQISKIKHKYFLLHTFSKYQ